jgi:D-glycero-alpha-D-manno-heptose 1-phosphate guanylyltransferase
LRTGLTQRHVILSVVYLRDVTIRRFGNRYCDVPIDYAIEETPLGTGGAIRSALDKAHDASVFVLNGDIYLEADLPALLNFHCSFR